MRPLRIFLAGSVLAVLIVLVPSAGAAEPRIDPALRQLYLSQITSASPPASLATRIETERARVRSEEQKQLTTLVEAANAGQGSAPESIETAVRQQQALVDMLKARQQEAQVDLDVLGDEEDALQDNETAAQGNALDGVRRRMADLLSRRAVLEERLSAIGGVLGEQQDRLTRLGAQERAEALDVLVRIAMYVGLLALIVVAERFVRRRLIVRIRDRNRRYFAVKIFTGSVYVLVIGWAIYRLSGDYPGFVTSFAIVGAGIAVALQSIIKDIVGWILIMQKRLFRIGQRVTIGPHTGDVADISLLRTTLVEVNNSATPDIARVGQTLYVPNSLVLEGPVLNFHATSDFVEAEIPVTVTYDSDWKQAEEILRKILKEQVGEYVERARAQHVHRTAHFFASQEPPEPRVFTDLSPDGILFTLRFQIPIGRKRSIVSAISHDILERFLQADPKISLAYKTVAIVQ
ncbi:MAG: mechanosensitive ion channel [Candidatus Peribacteraceae bacterium]|nr:mechanosensitive ion channel [Candidatus Peribacteraceae bacterium]